MREITVKLFKFDELSDDAKEKAREWYRDGQDFSFVSEHVLEDAKNVGLRIISLDQHRANKGVFDKHAENTAERILKEHGAECETAKIARNFLFDVRQARKEFPEDENGFTNPDYEDKVSELADTFLHDILEDYRVMLEKDIEYESSDEQVDETIRINEYEFTEDGRRAH